MDEMMAVSPIKMPPIKMLGLIDRRHDLDLGAFSAHWRTTHRELALRLVAPGIMRGYIQNHRLPIPIPGLDAPADGSPELWVPSVADVQRLPNSREYLDGAFHDEPRFMEGRSRGIVATETVIFDGPGRERVRGVKAMLFFRRAPGLDQAEFGRAWNAVPHPLLLPEATKPLRLTRHVSIEDARNGDTRQVYDGAEFSWWPDVAAFLEAWRANTPSHPTIDPAGTKGMLVREEPVLWPGHARAEPPFQPPADPE